MVETDMREVVRRLHLENSAAVLELLEFDYATEELLRNFEHLVLASQQVHTASRKIVLSDNDQSFESVGMVQEYAGRLSAQATQILGAFREMRFAVQAWNIAETRRPSNKPDQGGKSSPSGAP